MRFFLLLLAFVLPLILWAEESYSYKLVKKKPQTFFYDPYLNYLNNKKNPLGEYDYVYTFGGQISYDIGYIDQEPTGYFQHDYRRIRLIHKGSILNKKFFYDLEYSFTGSENFKDVFAGYQNKTLPLESRLQISAGNQKVPLSWSRYTSSKNLSFMERPLSDVFSFQRKLSLVTTLEKKVGKQRYNLALAYFQNSIDEMQDDKVQKPGAALRLAYSNKLGKQNILYLGYSLLYQDYNEDKLRYKQESESNLIEEKYLSVKIKNVHSLNNHHIDILYKKKKFYTLASYTLSNIDALKNSYSFYGYNAEMSYFLIGKGKPLNRFENKFKKLKPNKDGAVELAFRYSYLNLNDKDEHGGEQSDYNFALNYYISKELKVMFNYILALPKNTDNYDGLLNIYQMRMQFAF